MDCRVPECLAPYARSEQLATSYGANTGSRASGPMQMYCAQQTLQKYHAPRCAILYHTVYTQLALTQIGGASWEVYVAKSPWPGPSYDLLKHVCVMGHMDVQSLLHPAQIGSAGVP